MNLNLWTAGSAAAVVVFFSCWGLARCPAIAGVPFAVDGAGDIFVATADGAGIERFAPGAQGDVAPVAVLRGPLAFSTGSGIRAIVVAGTKLFVGVEINDDKTAVHEGEVVVFPVTASGNVAPESFVGTWQLGGLAIDASGGIFPIDMEGRMVSLYLSGNPNAPHYSRSDVVTPSPISNAIFDSQQRLYYADDASNVMLSAPQVAAPWRKILNTGGSGNYLALDGDGRLYVGVNGGRVLIVTGATRGAPVVSNLVGPPMLLEGLEGLSIDSSGKVYVLNCSHDGTASVLVFPPGARDDAAPIATLAGAKTGLSCSFPGAIAH